MTDKPNVFASSDCGTAIGPIPVFDSTPIIGFTNEVPSNIIRGILTCGADVPGISLRPAWYKMIGTGGTVTASTCPETSSDSDSISTVKGGTSIAVFDGNCNTNLKCVESQRAQCDDGMSVTWSTETGNVYYIMVFSSDVTSPFVLTVQPTPINDSCPQASGPLTIGSVEYGSTRSASLVDLGGVTGCSSVSGLRRGVWYTVFGRGTTLRASTCHHVTSIDARVVVFSTSVEFDATYEEKCGNLSCVSTESSCSVTWLALKAEEYLLFVGGSPGIGGNFGLEVVEAPRG